MASFWLVPYGKNRCLWDTDFEVFFFISVSAMHPSEQDSYCQNIQSSTRVLNKIHGNMEIQTNCFLRNICHSCFAIQISIICSRNHPSLVPLTQAILRSGLQLFVYSHIFLLDPFKSGKEQELSHYVSISLKIYKIQYCEVLRNGRRPGQTFVSPVKPLHTIISR
jgi:hypothetical protein